MPAPPLEVVEVPGPPGFVAVLLDDELVLEVGLVVALLVVVGVVVVVLVVLDGLVLVLVLELEQPRAASSLTVVAP